jgi:hypothetical protein
VASADAVRLLALELLAQTIRGAAQEPGDLHL